MDGTDGDLYLFGIKAGAFTAWEIRASVGALTFQATGSFAQAWVTAGATRARVRCVARDRDRRPSDPARPDYSFVADGDITELSATRVVLTHVQKVQDGR